MQNAEFRMKNRENYVLNSFFCILRSAFSINAIPPTSAIVIHKLPSIPNVPPVIHAGPDPTVCSSDVRATYPLTPKPRMGPERMFQARWIPIGNHSRR